MSERGAFQAGRIECPDSPRVRPGQRNSFVREEGMPSYEFLCLECKNRFSLIMALAEHEKGGAKCPKCGSKKVEQQWAAFYATTSKKS
jgi:putative FmdB family regulatory protein